MVTINQTLEQSMQLDFASREMLIEILQKRQIEERRKEIAQNAKKSKTALSSQKIKPMSSNETIAHLNTLM